MPNDNTLFPRNRSQEYYESLLATIKPANSDKADQMRGDVNKIENMLPACEDVVKGTKVPAIFLALRQMMEAGGSFNGQPFDGRPWSHANKIYKGVIIGPYSTWEESATAFIFGKAQYQPDYSKMDYWPDWKILLLLECGNGLAYANRDRNSPYLVGGSNFDSPGKYTSDGVYDPNATTKQIGAALLLKEFRARDTERKSAKQEQAAPAPVAADTITVSRAAFEQMYADMTTARAQFNAAIESMNKLRG